MARFAPVLVPIEASKIEKFVAGLNLDTRMALVMLKFQPLSEAYSSAADNYRVLMIQREMLERHKRKNEGSGAPSFGRSIVADKDIPNTTFRTRYGHYEFTVMSLG